MLRTTNMHTHTHTRAKKTRSSFTQAHCHYVLSRLRNLFFLSHSFSLVSLTRFATSSFLTQHTPHTNQSRKDHRRCCRPGWPPGSQPQLPTLWLQPSAHKPVARCKSGEPLHGNDFTQRCAHTPQHTHTRTNASTHKRAQVTSLKQQGARTTAQPQPSSTASPSTSPKQSTHDVASSQPQICAQHTKRRIRGLVSEGTHNAERSRSAPTA